MEGEAESPETPSSPWLSRTFGTSMSMHVDRGVGAMSISPSHRDVVLGSRAGLYVLDLDDPFVPPRFLPHHTAWEVADVQWSPHAAKHTWIVSTSNQKAMVWNVALPSARAIEHVLHAHSRAITDINFHAHDPERLATCAIDAFVYTWDMRRPQRPAGQFCDWRAGATQVKWSRRNPHVVASSHDRFVRVWDDRMGARPLRSIRAHDTKINGIDFSRVDESRLLTCSLDKTIKLWDYAAPGETPLHVVHTEFPVWRARHLPFGRGYVAMPQRGGGDAVYIATGPGAPDAAAAPCAHETLDPAVVLGGPGGGGHTGPVKEFLWRSRGGEAGFENREFQLVTWGRDNDLRLWAITPDMLDRLHFRRGARIPFNLTRHGAPYRTFSREPAAAAAAPAGIVQAPRASMTRGSGQQHAISQLKWLAGVRVGRAAFAAVPDARTDNLGSEVSAVGRLFPHIVFEQIKVSKGRVVLALNGPWGDDGALVFLRATVSFPPSYPAAPPVFAFEESKTLTPGRLADLRAGVDRIAADAAARGRFSLERCLRYLVGDAVDAKPDDDSSDDELIV
ncbi:WD40-repeat-containing domain protein [Dipodascopsis tothii]|uniref:WD40-repeat-containing domain protein n=1 Tax=Dipodascopsis tothii TaxID=44089 RepID=UPI0034CF95B6